MGAEKLVPPVYKKGAVKEDMPNSVYSVGLAIDEAAGACDVVFSSLAEGGRVLTIEAVSGVGWMCRIGGGFLRREFLG